MPARAWLADAGHHHFIVMVMKVQFAETSIPELSAPKVKHEGGRVLKDFTLPY